MQILFLILLLTYIFFAVYIFFKADSAIFLPRSASYEDSETILKLPVNDKEKISAIYLPNPRSTYTLLYIHGNAEDLGDILPLLERLHSWGFSIFAYDYRGYGTSDGKPSEYNAYQDANAAYQYLTQELGISADRVIAYGRSIGGGSAIELATRYPLGGLILESTFISAFRVVVPVLILPFDKFSNLRKIRNIRCPVLVMHGKVDRIIPIQHGYTLFEAAPQPKLYLWDEKSGHNDFTWVAGEKHRQALAEFQQLLGNR